MKIRSVRAWQPIASNSPRGWRTSLGQIAVVIETNNSLVGCGVAGEIRVAGRPGFGVTLRDVVPCPAVSLGPGVEGCLPRRRAPACSRRSAVTPLDGSNPSIPLCPSKPGEGERGV